MPGSGGVFCGVDTHTEQLAVNLVKQQAVRLPQRVKLPLALDTLPLLVGEAETVKQRRKVTLTGN
jgi:hypothetical protein